MADGVNILQRTEHIKLEESEYSKSKRKESGKAWRDVMKTNRMHAGDGGHSHYKDIENL